MLFRKLSILAINTVSSDLDGNGKGWIEFESRVDIVPSARISHDDWVEMGQPFTVTISIEPGDVLNA